MPPPHNNRSEQASSAWCMNSCCFLVHAGKGSASSPGFPPARGNESQLTPSTQYRRLEYLILPSWQFIVCIYQGTPPSP